MFTETKIELPFTIIESIEGSYKYIFVYIGKKEVGRMYYCDGEQRTPGWYDSSNHLLDVDYDVAVSKLLYKNNLTDGFQYKAWALNILVHSATYQVTQMFVTESEAHTWWADNKDKWLSEHHFKPQDISAVYIVPEY